MALSKNEKENIVKEVKEVASNASSLVISDARGLKVSELSEIRNKANQSGIHIQVIKNSLAKLAFDGTDFGGPNASRWPIRSPSGSPNDAQVVAN